MFPVNPFSNTAAIPATVLGIQSKLGTPNVQVTTTPVVPNSYGQYFATADKANIVFGLQSVQNLISNGQILSLNTTQTNAIANLLASWNVANPYGASIPGIVTIPAAALQNTVITMQAMNYLQTTGLLTTTTDLIDSNGQIQMVTGFAPNSALTITIHDQHCICAVPNAGQWLVSNVGDGTGWNPLAVGVMETYSDQPVAVDQCYGYVIVFGQQSLEWWVDSPGASGDTYMPYVILPGAAQNIGLAAVFSRAQFMGNLVFLGRFKTGQMHVLMTNGTGIPTLISTPDIDQIINNLPNGQYQDAIASTDTFNGHPVYILTFVSAARTFVFDGLTQIWSEIQSGTDEYNRHMTTLRATFNNGTLASDYASGNVYYVDQNNFTDNGYIITREWVSKHVRVDGNIFSVPFLELNMQTGVGYQNTGNLPQPFTANPHIEVSVSTDGGYTWSEPQPAELGEVGQYTQRVYWRQLGTGRDFLFKFRCTDPVPFIVAGGYATIQPGEPD